MSIYDKSSLVLIPSGTKTGKVYSQKPVSGDGDFTFSRSTAATRVNADGNIEKETQNKLTYSNTFDQWSPKRGTLSQGVTDPFGGNNAWSLTATDIDPYLYNQTAWSGVVTLSIWAKGVGSSIGKPIQLRMGGSFEEFTLTGDWQRFEKFTNGSASNIGIEVPNPAVAGDVVHIYGAQLEDGLVARDYIETTTAAVEGGITDNVPRLDYTDSSCPALLLEPQRTNIFTQSEHFDGNDWTSYGGVVLTSNNAVSPEGVQNATKMIDAGGVYDQIPYTQNTDYTYSVFAKTDTATSITIGFVDQAAGYLGGKIRYTFATNVASVLEQSANESVTAHREDYGNGWFRVIIRFKTNVAQNYNYQFIEFDGGDGWIYGAQLEAGSYATSYIPTYGTSVTMNADACSTSNVEELIGQTEGTIFYQGLVEKTTGNDGHAIAFTQDANGNGSSRFLLYRTNSTGNMKVYFQNTSGVAFGQATLPIPTSSNDKYAIAYSTNDLAIYVNGVLEHTQSVGVIPTTKFVNINKWTGNMKHKNECRNVLLFKTRLTNAELADLTTL